MARKKKQDASLTEVYRQADELLASIGHARQVMGEVERNYLAEMETARKRYGDSLEAQRDYLKDLENTLRALMKSAKGQLFVGGDRVDLPHGVLIHALELKVNRARKMLERLEAIGRLDVIKVVKAVDWDLLETWSDDDLAAVGTHRKPVETFGYEVRA
jgi:hypothetical protein